MKKIICFIFGHKYRIVQHFDERHRRIKCSRCKNDSIMSDEEKVLLEWDTEFEQTYREFGHKIKEPIFGYNGG